MRGIKTSILSLTLLAAACGQDYFPLQTGNVWVYKGTGTRAGSPLLVEVAGTTQYGGVTYSVVKGLTPSDTFLREDDSGNVFAYDAAAGAEKTWFSFQAPEGVAYDSAVSCCGKAMVSSRAAKYSGPIGTFDYALSMSYPGVFQVGIANDLFLPYIGLISRNIATGGPSYGGYDLIYARLGGVTVVSAAENSFTLTLDKAVYSGKTIDVIARLTLRVNQSEPLQLTFPTGQMYDLVFTNDKGREVYRWSLGKLFAQIMTTISVSGEKNWVIETSLDTANLPAGPYRAEGYLTTQGGKIYSSTVGFEIR